MGHLNHLKKEYANLADRLNKNINGLPLPENGIAREGWKRILHLLYDPIEAEIGSQLPLSPVTINDLCKIINIEIKKLTTILNSMAEKGLVMDIVDPKTDDTYYSLSPPVFGFFELTMMKLGKEKIPKKEFVDALSAYCCDNNLFAREIHGQCNTPIGRTIVYENLFQSGKIPRIYSWNDAIAIINEAKNIAISKCYCRHKQEHLGKKCNNPIETCMSLNNFGEYVIRRNFGRKIDINEAKDILVKCKEHNLVHMIDNVKTRPAWLCNCCKCCCGIINSINKFSFPAAMPSNYMPALDLIKCKSCQQCIKLCPVSAISFNKSKDIKMIIDETKCLGCGICINNCPSNALILIKRHKQPFVPNSRLELNILRAFEKGKLPELIFEQGTNWGYELLQLIIKVVLSLSANNQNIVAEQLKSRFIKWLVRSKCSFQLNEAL